MIFLKFLLSKTKKDSKKKHMKNIKIYQRKKKTKGKKSLRKISKLLKRKKKKCVSIIRNVSRSYLSMEEIII